LFCLHFRAAYRTATQPHKLVLYHINQMHTCTLN